MKLHMFLVFLFLSLLTSITLVYSSIDPNATLMTGSFTFIVANTSTTTTTTTPTFSCAGCNTGTCVCGVSGCKNGTFDYYSSSECSMIPYKEGIFSDGSFSFSINENIYMEIFCDDGSSSLCTAITYSPQSTTTTTSTTTSTTTTTISKTTCPYECCFDDVNYFDKSCNSGSVCANNICYATTSTTTAAGYHISFSLVASSFVSIFLLLFLVYYVFGVVLGRRSARWVSKRR